MFMTENKSEESAKKQALDRALKMIEKDYGKGSIMKMGDDTHLNIKTISTGLPSLDVALGAGGIPRGRVTEIFGNESSGKTSLALSCVASVQKKGGTAAYIDAENALDPVYAKNIGVNLDDLYIAQPNSGEDALDIANKLISSGAIDLIVIDSVAALVPRAEIDGEMGDSHVGLLARLMSQALRKMSNAISQTSTAVIFINQIRDKVGAFSPFGTPETTPGGHALKFYSSVRIKMARGQQVKQGSDVIGNKVNVTIVKNKIAAPFKKIELYNTYGRGFDPIFDTINIAVDKGVIKKGGAWFTYGDHRWQGMQNAEEGLASDLDLLDEIKAKLNPTSSTDSSDIKDSKKDKSKSTKFASETKSDVKN